MYFFAPPVFIGDEEKTRTAQILNAIIWFNALSWVLALVAMPFTAQPLLGSLIVGSMLIIALGAVAALRAGHVRMVSWGFVLFLWSATVILVAISGGMVNPETAGFLVAILMAGMLSGIGAVVAFGALSLAASVVITWLDAQGYLPVLLPITPFVGLLIAAVNIILTTGLLWVTLSGWRQALKRSQQYARDLEQARANLEIRVAERTQRSEQARHEAEAARQQAEDANQALGTQMWQVAGQSQLNEALRGDQDLPTLADGVVSFLCHYLKLPVGVFYVRNGERLHLVGGYAAPQGLQSAFNLGEGVLGQAAREKRLILFEQPAQYAALKVTSALGESAPLHVAILPLVYTDNLLGVLELGAFEPFAERAVQLLERVAQSIAVALRSAQTRAQLNELLEETQRQAEELQAQEEELRAANEELLAQAERMRAEMGGIYA
jgi:putative methionine-R-sulfoxide reductase with GAF domain